MKKIFSLFSALLLTVSMWGAYEYNTTINGEVTLTDLTYELGGFTIYKYQLDFAQEGVNASGSSYNSTACMILEPSEEGLAGTYRKDDYSMNSGSYVYYNNAYRYVCDYTGKPTEIVITDNQDGSYTISGAFRTKNGNNYYYYYFDGTDPKNTFTPVAPDPFIDEPAKGDDITFNGNTWYATLPKSFDGSYLCLDLYDAEYNELYLQIVADKDTLEAGTYTVGTEIVASTQKEGNYLDHSYFYSSKFENYFIVGGALEISYSDDLKKLLMVGDLTTGHGTTIKVNNEVENLWYVDPGTSTAIDNVKTAKQAVKELINGQLYIRQEGKLYNVLGF